MQSSFEYKNWKVQYTLNDGARLDALSFKGVELLTTVPSNFRKPDNDFGEYENRPVYGYDDCFPSVSECKYPDLDWVVPDHGEVCWLPWTLKQDANVLDFEVTSKKTPLTLKRKLVFEEDKLVWSFEVINNGGKKYPFQHVIHPLMPLASVAGIKLPEFTSVFDEIASKNREFSSSAEIENFLLSQPKGVANMFYLQKVSKGSLSLIFKQGIELEMIFSNELFPTIGIWWNNNGYPNEEGIKRNECAFEPIPGKNSTLSDTHEDEECLYVQPNEVVSWTIEWKIS